MPKIIVLMKIYYALLKTGIVPKTDEDYKLINFPEQGSLMTNLSTYISIYITV